MYYEGWGRPGDRGLIAERGGRPVGAVWYRLFTEAVHGDGYVAPDVPELAIAVVEGERGHGIGRRLLLAMADVARADGVRRIALSVESGDPAAGLYASVGYVPHEPDDGKGRMVLSLGRDEQIR
jgi:GNAT superfamily N-acetyltransferase